MKELKFTLNYHLYLLLWNTALFWDKQRQYSQVLRVPDNNKYGSVVLLYYSQTNYVMI